MKNVRDAYTYSGTFDAELWYIYLFGTVPCRHEYEVKDGERIDFMKLKVSELQKHFNSTIIFRRYSYEVIDKSEIEKDDECIDQGARSGEKADPGQPAAPGRRGGTCRGPRGCRDAAGSLVFRARRGPGTVGGGSGSGCNGRRRAGKRPAAGPQHGSGRGRGRLRTAGADGDGAGA